MTNYRNSKLVERYEDVVFELDKSLIIPADDDAALQAKDGYRFIIDNTGETTPFDWYNARFNVDFKVRKADGTVIALADHNGIVNSSSALLKKLIVKMNGVSVYECDEANHITNVKNLLEYSQAYVKSQGTNEFFYLDTNRHAEERQFVASGTNQLGKFRPEYNSGFAARKALLGTGAESVNVEIPLNRYGFFESLHGELLPNSRIELNVDLESDNDVIWQAADECKVIITKWQLLVPRIVFNADGKSMYMDKFLNTRRWTYLRELVVLSNSMTQQSGTFRISTAINKPRHVFVFIINDASVADATAQQNNKFLYNTFTPANRHLTSAYLEAGNGKEYPEVRYRPRTEPTRVFRDVLKYVHANNDYAGDTLLNRSNFSSIYSFLYFDLTKQADDVKDGMTKLNFKYTLSGVANAAYTIYSLVLYEQDVELIKTSGRLVLREM